MLIGNITNIDTVG